MRPARSSEKAGSSWIAQACNSIWPQAAGARVALETGGHSAWVSEAIEQRGHEAVVARRSYRTDHHDARQLARLARVDPALLNPVELRSRAEQVDLFVIRARTMLINSVGARACAAQPHGEEADGGRGRAKTSGAVAPAMEPAGNLSAVSGSDGGIVQP